MQEYQRPDGSIFHELISANSLEELHDRLRAKQAEQEVQGNTFLGERMLTKNSKCPCGSGKKIKRCCRFIR